MTAADVTVHKPASRFAAIVRYTFQSCLPPRRWLGIIVACCGALLFGLLSQTMSYSPAHRFADMAAEGILSLVMPIAALIIGDAVLGAEVRAGTFHFTWLSPTPGWQIATGRWIGGAAVAMVTIGPAVALAAVFGGVPEAIAPLVIAATCGAIAYVALFIAVACITRRTAVWSLAIVFLVERLLGGVLTAIAQISPTWMSRAAFAGLLDDPPNRLLQDGVPHGGDAIVRLAIITIVSLVLASWRIRHMKLSGATD